MDFRVVVNIDRAARPTLAARARAFVRGKGPETEFWAAAETAVNETPKSYAATEIPAPDMGRRNRLATSVGAIH
jgi:hypothetical protein